MHVNEYLFNQWLSYRNNQRLIFLTAAPTDYIFEQIFDPKEQFETWLDLKHFEKNVYQKPWNRGRWSVYDQVIKLKFLIHHIKRKGLASPLSAVWNYNTNRCQINSGNGRLQALAILNNIGYNFHVPLYLIIREQDLVNIKYPYIDISSYNKLKEIMLFSNQKEDSIKMTFWNSYVDDNNIMRKTPTLPVLSQEILFSILIEDYGKPYENKAYEFHGNTSEFIDCALPIDLCIIYNNLEEFEERKQILLNNLSISNYFNITKTVSNTTAAIVIYDNFKLLTERELYEFFFWVDLNKPIINFKRYGYAFLNLKHSYFKSKNVLDVINNIDLINSLED